MNLRTVTKQEVSDEYREEVAMKVIDLMDHEGKDSLFFIHGNLMVYAVRHASDDISVTVGDMTHVCTIETELSDK